MIQQQTNYNSNTVIKLQHCMQIKTNSNEIDLEIKIETTLKK